MAFMRTKLERFSGLGKSFPQGMVTGIIRLRRHFGAVIPSSARPSAQQAVAGGLDVRLQPLEEGFTLQAGRDWRQYLDTDGARPAHEGVARPVKPELSATGRQGTPKAA